jgi:hypothetical protein
VRINTNLIYTHNLMISNFENPALPKLENRLLEELGDPKDEFRWDVDLTYREFTLRLPHALYRRDVHQHL